MTDTTSDGTRAADGGLQLSRVGLGCNNFGKFLDADRAAELVSVALEEGVTLFDTADVYGDTDSETFLGRALAGRRDEATIATKFGVRFGRCPGGARPDEVRRSLEASLTRLGTDRVDLYQLHYAGPPWLPEAVPVEDTLGALDELVTEGKIRSIGCSNFTADELRAAADAAQNRRLRPFQVVQNEYSLLHRSPERDVLPACRELGMLFVPYFPLASGLLTGKYRRGTDAPEGTRLHSGWTNWSGMASGENFDLIDALDAFATEHGRTLVELALGYLLAQPAVPSVVVGATKVEQVRSNARSADWQLTADELATVDAITAATVDRPLRSAELATS